MPTLRRVLVPFIAHLFVMWRGWWQGTAGTSSRRGKTRLISAAVEDRQRRVARESWVGRRALAESEDRSTSRLDGARVTTMAAQARRRSRIHLALPCASVAERVGFEPTKSCDSTLFKSVAFNRSATSPRGGYPAIRIRRRTGMPSSGLGGRAGAGWGPGVAWEATPAGRGGSGRARGAIGAGCRVGSDARGSRRLRGRARDRGVAWVATPEIQRRAAGQLRGSMTSRPRYGRNTSGTVTVPSRR